MPIINNNWLEYTHTPDLYEMLLIGFQQFAAITFAFDILSVGIRAHFFASLSLSQHLNRMKLQTLCVMLKRHF